MKKLYNIITFSLLIFLIKGIVIAKNPDIKKKYEISLNIKNAENLSYPSRLRRLMFVPNAGGKHPIHYLTIKAHNISAVKNSSFNCYALSLGFPKYQYPDINTINLIKSSKKKFWPRIIFPEMLTKEPQYRFELWENTIIEKGLFNVKESLELAKKTGAEGIFIDPEFYRNRDNYSILYLSNKYNKTPEETIRRLKNIGAQVADITNLIYNNKKVILWFSFANLNAKKDNGYLSSISYIIEGILDRIIELNYNIDVLDGGELSLGYINLSLSDIKYKIERRSIIMAPFIKKYFPHYKLAGTTVIFDDINKAGGMQKFVDRVPEDKKEIRKLHDYLPLLKILFDNYEYVWIYWGGGNPPYNDFDPEIAQPYRTVIKDALPEGYIQNY
jgi:hypothetical protein